MGRVGAKGECLDVLVVTKLAKLFKYEGTSSTSGNIM